MSRVIKLSSSDGLADSGHVVLSPADLLRQFRDATDEARDILNRAQQQADVIRRTAQAEAGAAVQRAYDDGYAAGLQEGAGKASELIARLEHDIAGVQAERDELISAVEADLLKLCIEAVEKVIRHEVKTDPRVVVRTIKSCLRRVKDRDHIEVRVNPAEVAAVRAVRDELVSLSEGSRSLSIVDDKRVSSGGCVVESASGTLDARVETQIDQLCRKLEQTFDTDGSHAGFGPTEVSQGDQPTGHDPA